jgi:hypothetical protein
VIKIAYMKGQISRIIRYSEDGLRIVLDILMNDGMLRQVDFASVGIPNRLHHVKHDGWTGLYDVYRIDDDTGDCTMQSVELPNSNVRHIDIDTNGVLGLSQSKNANGIRSDITYHSNGSVFRRQELKTDGTGSIHWWDFDGKLIATIELRSGGPFAGVMLVPTESQTRWKLVNYLDGRSGEILGEVVFSKPGR